MFRKGHKVNHTLCSATLDVDTTFDKLEAYAVKGALEHDAQAWVIWPCSGDSQQEGLAM